jgi:glyoxylase-like metal-dependent hydrolase (beta-lactamase superfamily II)/uncharacterized protein with ACT and thioredoxin-like domain
MKTMHTSIKVFRQLSPAASDPAKALLVKFRSYLPDHPGSLAGFASAIAQAGGNISFFHYDRAADGSCVAVNVQIDTEAGLQTLLDSLAEKHFTFESNHAPEHEILVTAAESVLEVKVRLVNTPGALAAFASLLAGHDANVTYMLYDEDIDAESADIAIVTENPSEVDLLLKAINEQGYHYRVVYRGSNEQEAANIIGLKMVEKFFLRLKRLLPSSDLAEIKSLVESSRDLYQDLVQFSTEAGNNLEAGDVFETVLTFASRSRSRIRDKFSATAMRPLRFHDRVTLQGFRLPTSENVYLLSDGNELAMIDAGHGIYYEDLKGLLRKHGMEPAQVKRIYVTHPDTDHVGSAGYFEREYGTQVFMHPASREVMAHMNRAHGAAGNLLNLNKYYTRLSSRFTECLFPGKPVYFPGQGTTRIGSFTLLSTFSFGPLVFEVLESLGGHTPGLVFFLNREFGLIFTSDFLLNVPSLSADEKEHLALYRYLLTSPNRDSRIYKEESAALKDLIAAMARELKSAGKDAYIFPGHGDYYSLDQVTDAAKSAAN